MGLSNTDFSSFTLQDTGWSLGDKAIYSASSGDVYLSAVYDTYFDANLGRTITVLLFYESELYTPIFAIEVNSATAARLLTVASTTIDGTSGDDALAGTSGDDIILAGAGNDEVIGGQGNDIISGGDGDDAFYSEANDGVDDFDGGNGVDTLTIASSANSIIDVVGETVATAGDDTDTFSSVEAFFAGSGDDQFIDGGAGRFYDGGDGSDAVAFAQDSSAYRITASGDGYLIERAYVDRDSAFELRYLRIENIENITFAGTAANFADVVAVDVIGTASPEVLTGTAKNDIILAGGGDDDLYGGAGSDLIDGGG